MQAIPHRTGIYQLTNSLTGERYIGSSGDMAQRITSHFSALRNKRHPNQQLQAAFDRDGADAFVAEVLEEHPGDNQLSKREYWYITQRRPEYNPPRAPIILDYEHSKMLDILLGYWRTTHDVKSLTASQVVADLIVEAVQQLPVEVQVAGGLHKAPELDPQ